MVNLRPSAAATNAPLRVGFLGGSINSAVGRTHRIAIEMDQRFKLVTGCFSSDTLSNESTAAAYGVPTDRLHPDLDSLLQAEAQSLDAIVVLTPTDQHAKQVIPCLTAGIPVICEKALATSSEEIRAIRDARDINKGFVAVTYNYLGYPMVRELRRMILDGQLGAVQQVHVEMPQEGFERLSAGDRPLTPQVWRLHDNFVPTISLDLGVHLHMITHYLTDKRPLSVVATSTSYGNFPQVVDTVSCIAKYADGLLSNIWYSKAALGERNGLQVRVFGEKGSAKWVQEFPECIHFTDHYGNKAVIDRASPTVKVANQERYMRFKAGHPSGFIEAFANYYFDIADALVQFRKGQTSSPADCFGVEDAYEGLLLLEAISLSSQSGSWENVGRETR